LIKCTVIHSLGNGQKRTEVKMYRQSGQEAVYRNESTSN